MYLPVPYLKPDLSNQKEVDQAHIRNKCIELGYITPRKGKNMTNVEQVNEVAVGVVEILDENGNPTGEYRRVGEDAPTEATIYTTAEDGDHEVTVN